MSLKEVQPGRPVKTHEPLKALESRFEAGELSSAALWLELDSLRAKGMLSRAERRQIFWNSHSDFSKWLLAKQSTLFFPQSAEWNSDDRVACDRADCMLGRTMLLSSIDVKLSLGRGWRRFLCIAMSTGLALALLIAAFFASRRPRLGLVLLAAAFLVVAGLIRALRRASAHLRVLEKERQAIGCWPQEEDQAISLTRREVVCDYFIDPGRLEMAIDSFQSGKLYSLELWQKLGSLSKRNGLSRADCRQIFWDAHSKEDQSKLMEFLPLASCLVGIREG